MYCTVVTQSRSIGIGEGLTYSCDASVRPGHLVSVPLRNAITTGIVLSVSDALPDGVADVKHVHSILLPEPLLPSSLISAALWVARENCSSLRYALGLWLPMLEWEKLLPAPIAGYRLCHGSPAIRGDKKTEVVSFLRSRDWVSEREILDHTSASKAVLRTMTASKILLPERRRPEFPGRMPDPPAVSPPELTTEQSKAFQVLRTATLPSLLFGVTGSGKTEVYESLIADVVAGGGQAVVLVPEILLSETIVHRFAAVIPPERISVVHSKLTPAQRRKEWVRARTGEAVLILGSRSALFSPCRNLRLIVIDEEHEWTYKNERMPRYHARTVAEHISRSTGAMLVLGSATPSVETWKAATESRYAMARLPHRYGSWPLPSVRVVDLAETEFGNHYPFSPPLVEAVNDRLSRNEQSVLFLNRRGSASALLCLDCRRRVVSPETQLPFTVHVGPHGRPYLLDHATGLRAEVPAQCPHCSSVRLHAVGSGTQKIESQLRVLFPKARVLRADSDTLESPSQMRDLLSSMERGAADILVGTQTVALGLDLPRVTLAGVLVADVGLSLPHFRASERVFQLLTQLSGRSGRRSPGEVIIQTYRPESLEVTAAASHDAERFLERELSMRRAMGYPPFSRMVRLVVRGPTASQRARQLHAQLLAKNVNKDKPARISVAPTFAGGGKEWHLLIRGDNPLDLLSGVALEDVAVDVDPLETL